MSVKATEAKQYILKLDDLEEIERQALVENREPGFLLVFLPKARSTSLPRAYRIVRDWGYGR